eukprot:7426353-Alexandrium_andersonii.AAC.1
MPKQLPNYMAIELAMGVIWCGLRMLKSSSMRVGGIAITKKPMLDIIHTGLHSWHSNTKQGTPPRGTPRGHTTAAQTPHGQPQS